MKNQYNLFLLIGVIILTIFLIHFSVASKSTNNTKNNSTSTITLAFVGDLMCHLPQIQAAREDSGKLNFYKFFEFIKDSISMADFSMGNLETTIADSTEQFTGYPRFRSPVEYLSAIKNSGFDLLFTANNHSLDYGEKGILKTIEQLKRLKLSYTGTYQNEADRDSLRIFSINNIQVCFIAATYGTNGNMITSKKKCFIDLINLDSLKNKINKAKSKGAELVIVNLHFGTEHSIQPDKNQRIIADSLIKIGADVIIGNHPHVLQPLRITKFKDSKLNFNLISYSLGNFFSNQRSLLNASGAILFITFEKSDSTQPIQISQIRILPTYVLKTKRNGRSDYRILPLSKKILENDSLYQLADHKLLKKSYFSTKEILLKEIQTEFHSLITIY